MPQPGLPLILLNHRQMRLFKVLCRKCGGSRLISVCTDKQKKANITKYSLGGHYINYYENDNNNSIKSDKENGFILV